MTSSLLNQKNSFGSQYKAFEQLRARTCSLHTDVLSERVDDGQTVDDAACYLPTVCLSGWTMVRPLTTLPIDPASDGNVLCRAPPNFWNFTMLNFVQSLT